MKRKLIKISRKTAVILGMLICLFSALAFYANVPTDLEPADVAVFQNDLKLSPFQHPKTFAEQITSNQGDSASGVCSRTSWRGHSRL